MPKATNTQKEEPMKKSRIMQILEDTWTTSKLHFTKKISQINWHDKSLDLAIIFLLISIALFIRILLAYQFRKEYGYGSPSIIWNNNLPFTFSNVYVEGFADFMAYYQPWIRGWYEENWYPYVFQEPYNALDYYSYPPVFLYFLVLTWRPGMTDFWMAFPMVFADAACAGVVYLIVKNILKKDYARGVGIFAGVLMALAPINVVYDGIYWLNPGPVTLLTLIAFYFAIKRKWWQAFFWLAIASMTKQNALFFTYPLFFVMLGQKTREKSIWEAIIESIGNALVYVLVVLILSVPWIFLTPFEYGRHMLFPGRSIELTTDIVDPPINDCVSFARSLYALAFPGWILRIVALGNYSMIWMILSATIIAVFLLWRSYSNKLDGTGFFEWIAAYTIFTHIFMPRGVYKFYTAYYVPMILIALICSLTHMLDNPKFLLIGLISSSSLFLGFNFWLITMNRFIVPFYLFMVAIAILILKTIRRFLISQKSKRINKKSIDNYLENQIGTKIAAKH
ncbi:MAG: hypothetical protein U9O98_05055 [Asgard group archaeon]|nr:hypothetical protein [Asgard group archaeon]